jgi:hypothetical protein
VSVGYRPVLLFGGALLSPDPLNRHEDPMVNSPTRTEQPTSVTGHAAAARPLSRDLSRAAL